MSDKQTEQVRGRALLHIIQAIATKTNKGVMYTAATLGAMALIPNIGLSAPLNTVALSLGVTLLGNLISRVASGNMISDDQIKQEIEGAIAKSGVDRLLTKEDFDFALNHLRKRQLSLDRRNRKILKILNRLKIVVSSIEKDKPIVIRDTEVNLEVEGGRRAVGIEVGQSAILSNVKSVVKAKRADVAIGIQVGLQRNQEQLKPVRRLPVISKPDKNSRTIFDIVSNYVLGIIAR